jgi:O-antigen/teichoic acid export membrane protein
MISLSTFPGMRLSLSRFSRQQVREVTAFSAYLFLISVAFQIGTNVDKLIIGAFAGTSAIAVYTVAVRLAEYQRQLCGQFSGLLFPLVVRFHERSDGDALRVTLLDGTRLGLGLVAGLTLCLITFGRPLIELWMGAGFSGSVVPLYVLALVGVVMVAQGPTGTILLGTGRHRLVAWTSVVEILLNVWLSVALVGRFGLTGVAIGTAVPYALLNLLVLMPVACRAVNVPLTTLTRVAAIPTIVALAPAMIAALALRSTGAPGSFVTLMTHASLLGIVYVVGFWTIGLRSADRARYMTSFRRIGRALTPRVATS